MDIAEKVLRQKKDFDDVYEAGKKAEYDALWDGIQDCGNRTDYNQGFKNWEGVKEITPKYLIVTLNISELFRGCKALETVPKVISTKDDGTFGMCYMGFYQCANLKSIDFDICVSGTNANAWSQSFYMCKKLQRIKKLGVLESQVFTETFQNCIALENLTIEGTIGQNGFDIHWSTLLSADSLKSIINALSTTTTGLTITLPNTAQSNYESKYGSGSWATLTATRSNWSIAYA